MALWLLAVANDPLRGLCRQDRVLLSCPKFDHRDSVSFKAIWIKTQLRMRGGEVSNPEEGDFVVPSDEVSEGSDASEWINPDMVNNLASSSAVSEQESEPSKDEDDSIGDEIGTLQQKKRKRGAEDK
eukprot:2029140-Rhodomonas_salina.1